MAAAMSNLLILFERFKVVLGHHPARQLGDWMRATRQNMRRGCIRIARNVLHMLQMEATPLGLFIRLGFYFLGSQNDDAHISL